MFFFLYRRYLQLCPDEAEDFVEYLKTVDRLDDAAIILAKIVNDQNFVSKAGKSNHTLWHELCELISKNPHKIKSLNVDAIIRGGLRRYTDQVGHLWNSLAGRMFLCYLKFEITFYFSEKFSFCLSGKCSSNAEFSRIQKQ